MKLRTKVAPLALGLVFAVSTARVAGAQTPPPQPTTPPAAQPAGQPRPARRPARRPGRPAAWIELDARRSASSTGEAAERLRGLIAK